MRDNKSPSSGSDNLFGSEDFIDLGWLKWLDEFEQSNKIQGVLGALLHGVTLDALNAVFPQRQRFPLVDDTILFLLGQVCQLDYLKHLYLALLNVAYYNKGLQMPSVLAGGRLENKNNQRWQVINKNNYESIQNDMLHGLAMSYVSRSLMLSVPSVLFNYQSYEEGLKQRIGIGTPFRVVECQLSIQVDAHTSILQTLEESLKSTYSALVKALENNKTLIIELIEDWRDVSLMSALNLLVAYQRVGDREFWLFFNIEEQKMAWWEFKANCFWLCEEGSKKISLYQVWQTSLETPEFGLDIFLPNALIRHTKKRLSPLYRPSIVPL